MYDGNADEAILAKERHVLDRWSKGDTRGYAEIASDDVTYFDSLGAHTRLDGIHALQSYLATLEGQIPEHTYEIIDAKVQVYGELGILTQRYHPFSLDGEPLTPWKSTTVYRHTNGEWCLVHAHWSMVKEAGD